MTAAQDVSQQALASIRISYEHLTGKPLQDVTRLDEYLGDVHSALGDVELLQKQFEGKSLEEIDFDAVKKTIRQAEGGEKRKELERLVEVVVTLEGLGKPDLDARTVEQQELLRLIDARDILLSTTSGDLFKKLYESADDLIRTGGQDDSKCPLCTSALNFSLTAHVQKQLEQYHGVADKIVKIKELWGLAKWPLRIALLERTPQLRRDDIKPISAELNLRGNAGQLSRDEVTAAIAQLSSLEDLLITQLTSLNSRKAELERELPSSLVQLTEQVEYGRQFKENINTYKIKQREEAGARGQLDLRERWRRFIVHATAVYSDAEAELSKNTIAGIDADYKAMFKEIMNVGDIVPDLQRADGKEDLHVQLSDFHGQHRLSARALLSESYRNALAISVFLAAAMRHSGAPRFVVLDDVTSSFDSGHQYLLMELIRRKLQQPSNSHGMQFIILSHDGLLEKYFDRHAEAGSDWLHNKLQGSPPMGAVLSQRQDANRLKITINTLLNAGQTTQAEPLIRQYLEYKLHQIIRKGNVPVPIDFAMKDHSHMVKNCLDAITSAVELNKKAGTLALDAQQAKDMDTVHVPALIGNWVSHYETGSGSNLSAPMLRGVITTIDDFGECFRYDDKTSGTTVRRFYPSLSK